MSEQNNVRRQPTVHRNGQRRKVSRVRMRELKRRRRNFLIAMAVAIILVICLIRFLVIQLLPKSDVTTLTVKDNGQIVLEEVIDLSKSAGSESELKSYVKNLVKDFDKDNGRDAVKIRRFSHVKGRMYVETRYKNAKTYSKFTGYTLYTGTVKEAMKSLIEQAKECDNVSVLYVLDSEGIYYGAIDLKDIITSAGDRTLDDLVMTSYPYVYGEEKIEDCIETLKDYSEESIPVLDEDNHILGVLTAQDVTEIVDDSMGEDYAKLGGLSAEEDLEEPLLDSIKKRLPWLMLLLVLGMVVSSVVGLFEKVVAQLTVVMLFQSLILDMAGNVGTQSLAVTIRVLMDEQLTGREKLKLIWKEVRVGSANGIVLGILALAGVGVYLMLFKHLALFAAFAVSGCIGISLVVAMLISSFVGTAVPIFFKQVGVDPAAASGPLITTITDMVGVVTYYGLSWILLIQLLGM